MFCPNCGTEVKAEAVYCPHCGKKLAVFDTTVSAGKMCGQQKTLLPEKTVGNITDSGTGICTGQPQGRQPPF